MDERTSAHVWEERYAPARVWSGEPNHTLVTQTQDLPPGTALDLGCGEGADAIWLAQRGWKVTGVDVSATALARAAEHAALGGVAPTWIEADLAHWRAETTYDLVAAFFLHSPVAFPRAEIFTRAAAAVTTGGVLLIVGHADFPPWSRFHEEPGAPARPGEHGRPNFATVEETIREAGLTDDWQILVADEQPRTVTSPDGIEAVINDTVVKARRLAR